MLSKLSAKLSEAVDFVVEHNIEFVAGAFVVGMLGLMIKYPDEFIVPEEKDNAEKVVVEIHHYHHKD